MLSYDSETPKTKEAYPIPRTTSISGVMRVPNMIVGQRVDVAPDKLYALDVSESAVQWLA